MLVVLASSGAVAKVIGSGVGGVLSARFSVPTLLARFDEKRVVSAVAAINGGLAILTIGVFAWIADIPLIYPALGPTAFILFATPTTPAAAPRSIILGHFLGLASGYAVWHLVSLVAGAPVSAQAGGWPLFLSASLGLAVICALLVWTSCPHPPACASSLVVALGGVTDGLPLVLMALAVVWMTTQAGVMNRLAGVPTARWSSIAPSVTDAP